jgi:EamA-like transporter family
MVLHHQSHAWKKRNKSHQGSAAMVQHAIAATIASPRVVTPLIAIIYILSGICQPLLMTVCKHAGLADSSAQLYMLFYYLGPAVVLFPTLFHRTCCKLSHPQQQYSNDDSAVSTAVVIKASMVAIFDIIAQSFNYTGASYAGATIFAMIYSSVTIWTAIFSRCLLHRNITYVQCIAILIVFCGLCITSFDSISLGSDVLRGTIYILIGSCMHGATYVLSEAIMMTSHERHNSNRNTSGSAVALNVASIDNDQRPEQKRELLTFMENSGIQGLVACIGLLSWQIVYTIPRWDELIRQPTQTAGTTFLQAAGVLLAFSLANLFHSLSFYYTVAHYPGGATSAGVMKGLQAVLVFVVAHFIYCNRNNDTTMCFTTMKFMSLITVVGGVAIFRMGASHFESSSPTINKAGYTTIHTDDSCAISPSC